MKRSVGLLIAALALAGCGREPPKAVSGYAEGEYVYVGAPEGGWVTQVAVQRGMTVKPGDVLFVLDGEAQVAQREQAAALLAQAQAQLANAQKGRRPDEIEALLAAIGEARASLSVAEAELKRASDLKKRGFVSQSALDTRQAQRDVAAQQLRQTEANLALARKGARNDEIAAAQANVAATQAALGRAEYALSQRRIVAKVGGRVEDTLRRAGEFVPPGGAVVQLLPPKNVKIRFFVPEELRAKFGVGTVVDVSCDACARGMKARVTFLSSSAEYTPPVIYSVGSREKLVWMVEAVPEGAVRLSPGQPLDVAMP